ncbi:MAG: hypothetical protein RLZZ585_171 [Bacteroidota bacterium]|jgi:hypothetical protein
MSVKKQLLIGKQYYHHHAFEILTAHKDVKSFLENSFTKEIDLTERIKLTKGKASEAIKAKELNKEIRRLLAINREFKFEVSEEMGVFYFSAGKSSIGGFDFALINHEENLVKLRNICFGELRYENNLSRWKNFLVKNPELNDFANKLMDNNNIGINIKHNTEKDKSPLIVGEIQFGNWGLAYRDFFKVLKANVQNSIDCLVYVVPTGKLEKKLSNAIVTFDKSLRIIQDFEKVINVPIWLVGLDIND